jgi:integrase
MAERGGPRLHARERRADSSAGVFGSVRAASLGAGLPKIPLHGLRHTHASLALQAGIHPKVVADRLGHYSAAFTLDVYSESIPSLQESAASLVAALVDESRALANG